MIFQLSMEKKLLWVIHEKNNPMSWTKGSKWKRSDYGL